MKPGFNLSMLKPKSNQTEDAHTFTKQAVKFKRTLSACQKSDGNRFLGQERSADGGIHATRNHNNVRSVP
jgi:hypothetical protein